MATVTICVDDHFRVGVGGRLDIQSYAGRRLVQTNTTSASSDGSFTTQSVLPGTNHLNVSHNWTNTTPVTQNVRVEIIPGSRLVKASQPNLVFFRHRATLDVGPLATVAAADPELTAVFDSEFGGGFDLQGEEGTTPAAGIYHYAQAIMPHVLEDVDVPPGEVLQVKYRCAHYSPDPWSNNANNNAPSYDATARNVSIQFWAMPVGQEG